MRTKCGDIKAAAISPSSHSHHIQIRRWRPGHGAKQNCNEPTRGEKWSCQRSFTNFHIARWGLVRRDHKQFGYQRTLKPPIGYDSDLSNLQIACILCEDSLTALARKMRKLPQQVVWWFTVSRFYQLLADSRSGELMRAITGEAPRMIYIPDQGRVLFHSTAALH